MFIEFLKERWNSVIVNGISISESIIQELTDTEERKHGEQIGFGTLVVHAVNDEY